MMTARDTGAPLCALVLGLVLLGCAQDGPVGQRAATATSVEPTRPAPPTEERALPGELRGTLHEALRAALADDEAVALRLSDFDDQAREEVAAFYAARDAKPAWLNHEADRQKGRALLAAACQALDDGLDPSAWPVAAAGERLAAASPGSSLEDLVDAELYLTATLLAYARDLRHGQVDPGEVRWRIDPEEAGQPPAHRVLLAALKSADPAAALRPAHPGYAPLRESLRELREVQSQGGWPEVDPGPVLEPGVEDERVAQVRARLAASGEWQGDTASPVFDEALQAAVLRFQANRGLEQDGKVGPETLRALREPVDAQVLRVRLNLERLRWLPDGIEGRHVVVNVPAYELEAKDGDRTVLQSPVVVGVSDWATPVMVSNIVRLEVNPEWRVPPRMTREEVFPKAQAEPSWVRRNNMQVIERATGRTVDPGEVDWENAGPSDYRFVQRAGPQNPMGEVKLAMDNRFSVYLHGTPDTEAFEQSGRALSHGCVRVKELDALTRFVLPRGDHRTYAQALETGEETWLELDAPVPVYFVYLTAWVAEDGTLQQRPDLYGRDRRLARALGEPDEDALACR
jgi:murein L,D-transpeptidase YcbB/YkuD